MNTKHNDLAFELAETWINGNRSDVIEALRGELPIVAVAIAFQINAIMVQRIYMSATDRSEFENAIDRMAETEAPNGIEDQKAIAAALRGIELFRKDRS